MILRKYIVELWEMTEPTRKVLEDIHYAFKEEEAELLFRNTMSRQYLSKLRFPLVFKAKEVGANEKITDKWGQKGK